MAVTVYSGPGTEDWRSTRYTATVNGSAAYVYGVTRTAVLSTIAWSNGASLDACTLVFAADETTTVVISKISGNITSAKVYPENSGAEWEIVGGDIQLTCPANVRLRIEVDGDRANAMHVFSCPILATPQENGDEVFDWATEMSLEAAIIDTGTDTIDFGIGHNFADGDRVRLVTAGTFPTVVGTALAHNTDYYAVLVSETSIQLSRTQGGEAIDITLAGTGATYVYPASYTNTTKALYFGPGVHEIGQLFALGDGVTVYVAGGAVLQGSWDLRGSQQVTLRGHGIVSGTWKRNDSSGTRVTPDWFNANVTGFGNRKLYAMVLGRDDINWRYDNAVEGLTFINSPYFLAIEGVWSWTNVHYLSPWFYSVDGFECTPRSDDDLRSQIVDCFAWAGDDVVKLEAGQPIGTTTVSGSFFVSASNSVLLFGYWPVADQTTTIVQDCHAMHLGVADIDSDAVGNDIERGQNTIIKMWCDGSNAQTTYSRRNVTISNLRVWGPMASRIFSIENILYPFDVALQRNAKGQVRNWVIEDLWTEETPGQISRLIGLDSSNTPHTMTFRNVEVGGVAVNSNNWSTFVLQNSFPYNITIDAPADFEVEDGAGLEEANSYCSVAAADIYHAAQGNPGLWYRATTVEKQQALREATQALDLRYGTSWSGNRKTSAQALDWPRTWAFDSAGNEISDDVIPSRLAKACAYAALLRLEGINLLPALGAIASESTSIDGMSRSVTYRSSTTAEPKLVQLDRMLATAGLIDGGLGWGFADL